MISSLFGGEPEWSPVPFTVIYFPKGFWGGRTCTVQNGDEDILGCFLHYDFVYNRIMNLSANSLGIGWIRGLEESFEEGTGSGQGTLSLLCGQTAARKTLPLKLEDLLFGEPEEERRNYDMGIGVNLKGRAEFPLGDRQCLWIRDSYYFLYLFPAAVPLGGSTGFAHRNILDTGFTLDMSSLWSLEAAFSWGMGADGLS